MSRILAFLGFLPAAKAAAFETKVITLFSLASGTPLSALNFTDAESGHASLRIERAALLELLIRALDEAGVRVESGKRLESVRELPADGECGGQRVAACFADGGDVAVKGRVCGGKFVGVEVASDVGSRWLKPEPLALPLGRLIRSVACHPSYHPDHQPCKPCKPGSI